MRNQSCKFYKLQEEISIILIIYEYSSPLNLASIYANPEILSIDQLYQSKFEKLETNTTIQNNLIAWIRIMQTFDRNLFHDFWESQKENIKKLLQKQQEHWAELV